VDNDSNAETTGRRLIYFAAERTLMAWIRVALGLMALGFVIDRFDLVVRQMTSLDKVPLHPNFLSKWGGAILTLQGTAMAFTAAIRYLRFHIRYQRRGSTEPGSGLYPGVLFAVSVAFMGIVIAFSIAAITH